MPPPRPEPLVKQDNSSVFFHNVNPTFRENAFLGAPASTEFCLQVLHKDMRYVSIIRVEGRE